MNPRFIERIVAGKAALDEQIASERKRPAPDALRLQALKRARLLAKDRLASIRAQIGKTRIGKSGTRSGGLPA